MGRPDCLVGILNILFPVGEYGAAVKLLAEVFVDVSGCSPLGLIGYSHGVGSDV